MNTSHPLSSTRLHSIDAFRGLAVLLMAAANYIAGVSWIPAFLKHAPDIGYTVIDVIAPMFITAIGLTMGQSALRRREKVGVAQALGGMAVRFLAILGIGAVITAGQALVLPGDGQIPGWGVLQAIGAAGLLTLAVIYAPLWVRAAAGIALLAIYQYLLDHYFLQTVLASSHNGLIGSLAWGGMLMLATAVFDCFFMAKTPVRQRLTLLIAGTGALAAGIFLSQWFPISKNRASISYMLVSLGLCLLVFLLIHALDGKPPRVKWLSAIGKNPLVMFSTHLLILGIYTLPNAPWWYADGPAWLVAVQGAMLLTLLVVLGRWMEKRKIIVKL